MVLTQDKFERNVKIISMVTKIAFDISDLLNSQQKLTRHLCTAFVDLIEKGTTESLSWNISSLPYSNSDQSTNLDPAETHNRIYWRVGFVMQRKVEEKGQHLKVKRDFTKRTEKRLTSSVL